MAKMKQPEVAVLMGSQNDYQVMSEAKRVLDEFGVESQVLVISAHRTPEACRKFAQHARAQGIKVIIAGAGKAAHLAGVIASYTTLPVIGVPLDASLGGLDALLSTVQMPAGVPVATMAIGKSGAVNAGLMAVAILALSQPELARRLEEFRRRQRQELEAKNKPAEQ
ncbi:MAG: 5-(carboxyamino)imidazole ribonucleotide mutase [candidate division WOR-3 bacterium]|jgi:5-(carboxyamino)imidazole ribonucleotide mutase